MTKRLFILFLVFSSTILLGQQNNKSPIKSMFADSTWKKENFFKARVEFVSIEKYPLMPCGYINDWTTAKLKIITTDNKIVNVGQVYTFYITCSTFENDKPKKGQKYNIEGVLKFPDTPDTEKMNSFKGDDVSSPKIRTIC